MKTLEFEQIEQAAVGAIGGTLAEWPYLAESLANQGIRLPLGTQSGALQTICRLIMTERKTVHPRLHEPEVKDLQQMLLEQDVYVSRSDIAECYGDFCRDFAFASWLPLSRWDNADHIGPVAYIVAMITK